MRGSLKVLVGPLTLLTLIAAVVAGCATPRAALGTSLSPCYQAIPVAAEAVGHQGRFAGLNRVGSEDVARMQRRFASKSTTTTVSAPNPSPAPSSAGRRPPGGAPPGVPRAGSKLGNRAVCLVAWKGKFDPARLPLLRGEQTSGQYAIVVVGVRGRMARAVFLSDHLPRSFKHL